MKKTIALLLSSLLTISTASAATTYTWSGGPTGTWDTSSLTWNSNTLAWPTLNPSDTIASIGANSTLTIASGTTLYANGLTAGNDVTLHSGNGSSKLVFTGPASTLSFGNNLYLNANTEVASGTALNLSGGLFMVGRRQVDGSALDSTFNANGQRLNVSLTGGLLVGARTQNAGNVTAVATLGATFDSTLASSAVFGLGILGGTAYTGNISGTLNLVGGTNSITLASGTAPFIYVGRLNLNNGTNTATVSGTLNISGGTTTLTQVGNSNGIILADRGVNPNINTTVSGQLNLTGGTLTMAADIYGGGGTSTVTLNGGTLDLGGGKLGRTGGLITTLNLQTGTLQNVASINNTEGLTKNTAGTLKVAGTNGWSGATTLSAGTLQVGSDTALGSGALILNTGNFSSDSTTARAISNAVTFGGDVTLGDATNTGRLTFNGAGTLTGTRTLTTESNVTYAGAIGGGANGLTKSGVGMLTLSGNNTYTGATLVTAGTLVIDGNQSTATGAVTVQSGATLAGSGTVGGATTISGHHAPGNSPGIQNFASDLSYTDGSSVTWELIGNTDLDRGINFDGINVVGDLTITGTSTINLVFNLGGSTVLWANTFWDTDQSWLFYDVADSLSGAFALGSISLDSAGNSLGVNRGSFAITYQGSDVYLTYSAIPEPSTTLLLAGALTTLVIFRRRRARN